MAEQLALMRTLYSQHVGDFFVKEALDFMLLEQSGGLIPNLQAATNLRRKVEEENAERANLNVLNLYADVGEINQAITIAINDMRTCCERAGLIERVGPPLNNNNGQPPHSPIQNNNNNNGQPPHSPIQNNNNNNNGQPPHSPIQNNNNNGQPPHNPIQNNNNGQPPHSPIQNNHGQPPHSPIQNNNGQPPHSPIQNNNNNGQPPHSPIKNNNNNNAEDVDMDEDAALQAQQKQEAEHWENLCTLAERLTLTFGIIDWFHVLTSLGNWEEAEHYNYIYRLQEYHRNKRRRFTQIANHIPTRTNDQVNHHHKSLTELAFDAILESLEAEEQNVEESDEENEEESDEENEEESDGESEGENSISF